MNQSVYRKVGAPVSLRLLHSAHNFLSTAVFTGATASVLLLLAGASVLGYGQDANFGPVQQPNPIKQNHVILPSSAPHNSSILHTPFASRAVRHNLTPVNTGPGIVYTCDPSIAAATCTYLNTTVAGWYNGTFTNANANIYITYGTTGLGQSEGYFNFVTYSHYLAAVTSNATKSAIQTSALSALNTYDAGPYSAGSVEISGALGTTLGFTGLTGITAPPSLAACTLGSAGCYNEIVTVTNDPSTPLYYDNLGGPEPADAYDFYAVVSHETDEVLGTSSCISTQSSSLTDPCDNALGLPAGTGTPSVVDLFRYSSSGVLVLDSSLSTTPGAYFSYNGGSTNGANGIGGTPKVYNTLANGDDYADFVSSSPDCGTDEAVQDATGCPGEDAGLSILNDGGGEINILNAVGFDVPATTAPALSIAKSHTGSFTQGQTGATYTITVTNSGTASTSGTVTVVDTLPTGLTATAIAGTGWTCTLSTLTCTSTTVEAAGASFPAITLTVNVAANAPASVTNSAAASGGGATVGATANDPTTINAVSSAPALSITKSHTGSFTQGQTGATYTITVTNSGTASTSGTVTVVDTLPTGLTATAIAGTGWTCTLSTLTCTSTTVEAAGASFPAITLTVNVAANAPASVTNSAAASGGGATVGATANDPTTINAVSGAPALSITKSHTGSFTQGQTGATYTITVTNSGTASTSGTVTVVDTLPTGLTATAIAGTGWTCTLGTLTCTSTTVEAAGASFPAITLTVNVAANAPASVTNSAAASGGGATGTATANDPTTITPVGPPPTVTDAFQIRYASNLNVGDAYVDITNSGASGGNICANVYTFDPAEELISCCTCSVTPNGLQTLSVLNSLTSNPLTPAVPAAVVIKLVATSGTCNAAAVTQGNLAPGMLAWSTSLHAGATSPVSYAVTETPFSNAALSAPELVHITSTCGFIQANGSGFGICKGCAAGGLGAAGLSQ